MLRNFKKNLEDPPRQESQFILTPRKKAGIRRRKEAIANAQKSIDVVNSWKRFRSSAFTYNEEIAKTLQKGVKIRVITEKTQNKKAFSEMVGKFKKTLNFETRFIAIPPTAVLSVYDKKEVLMKILPTAGLAESDTLWSSNSSLLAIAQDYFENLWLTAVKDETAE
jgi:predicted transcriptional regulator